MRSLARIGLDRLLDMYSTSNLIYAEWEGSGGWLLISLGHDNGDGHVVNHFAINKRTGAVHTMKDGQVTDEPLLSV